MATHLSLRASVQVSLVLAGIAIGCSSSPRDRSASTLPSTAPTALIPPLAPTKTLAEVAATAKQDVYWLADDAREGRGMGSQGLEASGDYIAARFKKLGLLPANGKDYFEPFDFDAGKELGPDTRLAFNGTAIDRSSFTGFTNSKTGAVSGKLAFVGYSIKSDDHDYNDFANIDVKGRIALALRWEPHNDEGKSKWDSSGDYTPNASINRKAAAAAEAGATALIFVNAPTHHEAVDPLMDARSGLRRKPPIPVFQVDPKTADAILAAGHAPTLAELQHEIDSTGKPASRLLDDVTIDANVELAPIRNGARNVVALLPGKGPHADEYVVIGAHYDHVGRGFYGSRTPNGSGQIHNGADDNASGTATLLELAEEFALAGRQDRSIVFASFTLEELGMVGSEAFVKHLPVPKEKIVGMLNLDMVGRMRNEFLYVGGSGTAQTYDPILKAADERSPITLKDMGKGGTGPSDHLSFSQAKIPVLFFYSGSHADYHTPTDDADKINYDGIAQVTYLAFDVVRGMCDMPRQMYVERFDNVEPDVDVMAGETPKMRRAAVVIRSRVAMGVEPDYSSDESVKGVKLGGIVPDSAAASAGLKAADIIVKMNDRAIDNLQDLTGFLADEKPGDVVKVSVIRANEPMTFDVTLKARSRT